MRGCPTEYRGTVFRSELEACWALAWHQRGIAWAYEPCRVWLGPGASYTPDFSLPTFGLLIQVKPAWPDGEATRRAGKASSLLGQPLYFVVGKPDRWPRFGRLLDFGRELYGVEAVLLPPWQETPGQAVCPGSVASGRSVTTVESDMASVWTQKASKSTGDGGAYPKAPPGNHLAVLVGIFDMGTQHVDGFQGAPGKWQRRAYFVWELVNEPVGPGRNHVIGVDLTISLNEKAKLRRWIEARTGKQIPEGSDLDISSELGQPCLLSVVMKGDWPKVDGVAAVPKGMKVDAPGYKPTILSLDDYQARGTVGIPEWVPYLFGRPLADHIKEAREFGGQAPQGGASAHAAGGPPNGAGAPPRPARNPSEPADDTQWVVMLPDGSTQAMSGADVRSWLQREQFQPANVYMRKASDSPAPISFKAASDFGFTPPIPF